MSTRVNRFLSMFVLLAAVMPVAQAAWPVIDLAAINQLVTEVRTLQQQLATARDTLTQAQTEFRAITGGRGMEQLLAGTVRNYLPSDWNSLQNALQGAGGAYAELAADLGSAIDALSVLSAQQLGGLSPAGSQQLQSDRQSVAMLQAIAHEALVTTSSRFASIQQLINAIPRAADQKAILDLQARIGAEESMLENEQTKLQVLYQSTLTEHWANEQRTREHIVAGHGRFESRFQPVP